MGWVRHGLLGRGREHSSVVALKMAKRYLYSLYTVIGFVILSLP